MMTMLDRRSRTGSKPSRFGRKRKPQDAPPPSAGPDEETVRIAAQGLPQATPRRPLAPGAQDRARPAAGRGPGRRRCGWSSSPATSRLARRRRHRHPDGGGVPRQAGRRRADRHAARAGRPRRDRGPGRVDRLGTQGRGLARLAAHRAHRRHRAHPGRRDRPRQRPAGAGRRAACSSAATTPGRAGCPWSARSPTPAARPWSRPPGWSTRCPPRVARRVDVVEVATSTRSSSSSPTAAGCCGGARRTPTRRPRCSPYSSSGRAADRRLRPGPPHHE